MNTFKSAGVLILIAAMGFSLCIRAESGEEDPTREARKALSALGLEPQALPLENFHKGVEPEKFQQRTGAPYKPSYNEEPGIPAQCWIETGYGTQNACLYCHTNYLASIKHGNAFPLAEDQILYSFPSPDLNKVLWRNTIFPGEIDARLKQEGVALPGPDDVAYVRRDNWKPAYGRARNNGGKGWLNPGAEAFALFPALNPAHLYPETDPDPTGGGAHGYVDREGFVRDEHSGYTGWRAVNFFPYGIFSPLTGSVSGIYIRLPEAFMNAEGTFSLETYIKNLDLLERHIKNRPAKETRYYGDASDIAVRRGFFPVGAEFAHPLHYVDLNADGQAGQACDGVSQEETLAYEFPGTRAKRLKEMRYMYKWKEVGVEDIDEHAHYEDAVIGHEGRGWVDNNAGWLLAGYIEDRQGALRPQTTEEMMQCAGCHGKVGNTVDSVWSFERKLPGDAGWREMDYGGYNADQPKRTRLTDYVHEGSETGELGFFYNTIIGADLYGVMPLEIARELRRFAADKSDSLDLKQDVDAIFNDELLKAMPRNERKAHLLERQKVMRAFVREQAYLEADEETGNLYVKGCLFYPEEATMKNNILLYRKIVLDQSYNLGKDVFGSGEEHVPFTFRSDGTVKEAEGRVIPVGDIIVSRPYDEEGVGITPTGIVAVNDDGEPVDADGQAVDVETEPEKAIGHLSTGGTFDTMYNPILSDRAVCLKK